ncbi:membrane protein [Lactococcus sp. DD01]|nr:membrane protein [Lactococcus sp. DD01]
MFGENVLNFVQQKGWGMLIIWLFPLLIVLPMQNAAMKNKSTALPWFILYSAMMGFLFSFTLVVYTASDVTLAFVSSAGMFFGLSIYGRVTKYNLSGMGRAMIGMLMGIIIAGGINFFLGSTMVVFLTSVISVVIFSGLIAWDNQKIELVYRQNNGYISQGWAISMALSLYLDFINLFITLLRLIGFTRKNQD